MSDNFLGEIRPVGFNFAPNGWALCNGQILPINQNTALFSLLGTQYGGNGTTTFALPNLQGRVAVGAGQGPGLTDYVPGEQGGVENLTLTTAQIPVHNHGVSVGTADATSVSPQGAIPAKAARTVYSSAGGTTMAPDSIGSAGGSQPHNNLQPFLVTNYIIALTGIFPSRN